MDIGPVRNLEAVSLNQRVGVPAILAAVDRWRFRLHARRIFRLRHWSCHRCQGVSGDNYCAAAGEPFAAACLFFFSRRLELRRRLVASQTSKNLKTACYDTKGLDHYSASGQLTANDYSCICTSVFIRLAIVTIAPLQCSA